MNKKGGVFEWGMVWTLILVILKLVGVIHWSWIWVVSPIWIPVLILYLIYIWSNIS